MYALGRLGISGLTPSAARSDTPAVNRRLTRLEERWLAVVLDAVLPIDLEPRLPSAAVRERYPDLARRFAGDLYALAPAETRLGLRLAIQVAIWWPVPTRLRPLPLLAREERSLVLERLSRSRIYLLREVANLFKVLACFAVAALPEVQAAMGVARTDPDPPPWVVPRHDP